MDRRELQATSLLRNAFYRRQDSLCRDMPTKATSVPWAVVRSPYTISRGSPHITGRLATIMPVMVYMALNIVMASSFFIRRRRWLEIIILSEIRFGSRSNFRCRRSTAVFQVLVSRTFDDRWVFFYQHYSCKHGDYLAHYAFSWRSVGFHLKIFGLSGSELLQLCSSFDASLQNRELCFVFTVTCMEFMEQQSRAVLMQGTNRHRHSICEECIVNLTMMAHTLLAWMRNVPSSFVIRIRFYDTMIVCP